MNENYIRLSLRITDDEKQKLDAYARLCGLTRAALIRQFCLGKAPKPRPPAEFWLLLDALYGVHHALRACAEHHPPALADCAKIEQFVLKLQAAVCIPEGRVV